MSINERSRTHAPFIEGRSCPDVRLEEPTPLIFEQHAFLSNSTNKDNFIQLLMSHLDREGCQTIHSEGDAEVDIIKEALTMASSEHQGPTAVVGDDTDLLVLLVCHWKEDVRCLAIVRG